MPQRFTPALIACAVLILPNLANAQQTEPPALKNAYEIRGRMFEEYTLEMRQLGLVGRPVVELMVRTNGRPAQLRVARRSGNGVLDRKAALIAREMRFEPARMNGEEVDQRVRLPIAFQSTCGVAPSVDEEPETAELLDGLDVASISEHLHPRSVLLDVRIDTLGRPISATVMESSGLPDTDSLAVRSALASRYEPVRWDGSPVPARFRQVSIPGIGGPSTPAAQCTGATTPVRLKNRDFVIRALEMIGRGMEDSQQPVGRDAAAFVWVRADGKVGEVRIHQSSCWDELDAYLTSVWMGMEFEPATCGGEAIGSYVIQPVQLRFPGR